MQQMHDGLSSVFFLTAEQKSTGCGYLTNCYDRETGCVLSGESSSFIRMRNILLTTESIRFEFNCDVLIHLS